MKKFQNSKQRKYLVGIVLVIVSVICVTYIFNQIAVYAQTDLQKDSDFDGLSDVAEINVYQTDPFKADTDGDGYLDAAEILAGSDPLNPSDPSESLSAKTSSKTVVATVSTFPWFLSRAAGIVGYILMFFIILLGSGMTTSYIYRYINPVKAWVVHKYLALALGLTLLIHIFSLLFDKFMNFGIKDILIPFFSNFKTVYLSAGIIAFYVLVVIIFTSLFIRLKYKRVWRGIHYAVYFLFTFSFIHGLFIGTDSKTIFMKTIYLSFGLIFIALLIYRFIIYLLKSRNSQST